MYIHVYSCMYVCMYVCMYIHTHMCTCTHPGSPGNRLWMSLSFLKTDALRSSGVPPLRSARCSTRQLSLVNCTILWQPLAHRYEQALVCISNWDIVDASRGRTCHCKMANNRLITVVFVLCRLNLFSHLASFNYNGLCPPNPRVDVFFFF